MVEQVLMKDYCNSGWLRSWVACRRWRPFVQRRSLGVVVRGMSEGEGEARSRGGTGTRKGPHCNASAFEKEKKLSTENS